MGDDSKVGQLDSIAVSTEGRTRPTTPAAGSNFDWPAVDGWDEVASYLGEDDISVTVREETLPVDPPQAQHTLRDILLKWGIEGMTIPLYEVGANALKDVYNVTQVGIKSTFDTSVRYVALVLAFNGVDMMYFPKVKVGLGTIVVGVKTLGAPALVCEVRQGATNERQTVNFDGAATGGTFTLTYSGQETGNIAFDAAASVVETALEALSNIAVGDVSVGAGPGKPWTVEFTGALARTDVAALTGDGTLLTGPGSPYAVTVAETIKGGVVVAGGMESYEFDGT